MKQPGSSGTAVLILTILLIASVTIEARHSRASQKTEDGDNMLGPGEAEFKKGQWRSKVKNMKATLTVRDFGGIGIGRKSRKCEGTYSTNFGYFVAMPSKWFENKKRCNKVVEIKRNGRTVTAEVVDECESDSECPNKNSIGASVAVWGALNIAGNIHAAVDVTWSDVNLNEFGHGCNLVQ